MGALIIFLLTAWPKIAAAAQRRNMTALRTRFAPAWVPEPDTRGTLSLLYSCIFTLALCVYLAIHLNTPAPGERPAKQILRRAKWVFAGIVAPKLGVYTAWQQWRWARRILKELGELKLEQENNPYRIASSLEIRNDQYPQPCVQLSIMCETPIQV